MDLEILKEAGLTDGEIRVYLALLKLGSSTTGPIVEESKITRSIIYQILDKLKVKGIVSCVTKEKTKYFQAANPERLLDYMDEREKQLKKNKEKIREMLPELQILKNNTEVNEVKMYRGFKGMITAHQELYTKLKRGESYYCMGIPPEQPGHHHSYWYKDHARRAKEGINVQLLFHPSTNRDDLEKRNSYKGCDSRYMPIPIDTPAWFLGFKDVTIISFPSSNPVTIEIINLEIANSFKAYFDSFWKDSKPLE